MNKASRLLPLIILVALLVENFNNGILRDPKGYIIHIILLLPGIIIGITFHEFAHAIVSSKLGDPTPKLQGRVTLNPAAHIDIYGFIALILCGFGWGQPVQIDNRYYKSKRRDEFLVSIAGVAMNVVLAFIFAFILKFFIAIASFNGPTFDLNTAKGIISTILAGIISVNVILAIFNLIPIPPLDGFQIINSIFDLEKYSWYQTIYNNGFIILMILLMLGVIDVVISPLSRGLNYFLMYNIVAGV